MLFTKHIVVNSYKLVKIEKRSSLFHLAFGQIYTIANFRCYSLTDRGATTGLSRTKYSDEKSYWISLIAWTCL